jgi:hypothetical protein
MVMPITTDNALLIACKRIAMLAAKGGVAQMAQANRHRAERLQIMLSAEELVALDDFRFRHRMPSRAAASREILRRGLGVAEKLASGGTQSSDFGVVHRTPVRVRASR